MKIVLNTSLFTDEDKQLVEQHLRDLITDLSTPLDISSLRQVIVPSDFTAEVIEFQRSHNKEEIGHRDSESGAAFAKVITYNEGTEFSQAIFLHEGLINGLYNEETSSDIVHYIHHELGHVHDNPYTKHTLNLLLNMGNNRNRLEALLQDHSNIIWSEYFANRCSYSTATPKIMINTFENVIDHITYVKEKSKEYIDNYRDNRDTLELINNFRQSTDLLFYYTAQSFGFLHPLRKQVDDIDKSNDVDKEILSRISHSYYLDTWNRIDQALSALYSTYPNWNSSSAFDELNQAVLQCWEELGVSMLMHDSELYIDVLSEV
ncbi:MULTISPECIES: hypothetical protein [Pseudobacillus]|uniref:hypothetical protein n=1 Tax=Pseudobacillus TaxID=108525 RepID=UPI00387A2097